MLSSELLKKIQHIYIKSRYLVSDMFSGEYKTAFRGIGMEFEEFREYIPGDDIRSIDWNVSARMDQPYVKVFREEREQTVMLLVDISASENFGSQTRLKKDVVTEIAAVLTFAATKSNDKVGLILFSDRVEKYIPPQKGKSHVWHVIQEILSFKPQGLKTDMKEALHFFSRVVRRKSVCFMISDFFVDNFETTLKAASFKHDMIAVIVNDPLEFNFPKSGLITIKDAETHKITTVDFSNKQLISIFEKEQKLRSESLIKKLRSSRVDCLTVKSDEDYIDSLLNFFKARDKKI